MSDTQTILLVDDHDDVRGLTCRFLESEGYRVVGFRSPVDALAWCRRDPDGFDLLLTDISMPGLDGLELAESVRRLRSGVPVLFLSGDSARIAGEACLTKPFRLEELSQHVRRMLDQRQWRGDL